MRDAQERRVFQSACLLVAYQNTPIFHSAYGAARLDTVFDLASLTKPLATTALIMRLVDLKQIQLTERLGDLLPDARSKTIGQASITRLLSHSAGLRAWHPYYQTGQRNKVHRTRSNRTRIRNRILDELPLYVPGSEAVYSDLGYLLLGWAIETRMGKPLDRLAKDLVYQPLALDRTFFRPTHGRQQSLNRFQFAPTEFCPGVNDG